MLELRPHPANGRERESPSASDAWFAEWRERELGRVTRAGITYLDYTGAALYPESLVRQDVQRLAGSVLGNPHSEHAPSRTATGDVDRARRAILAYLHADPEEYVVVLTPNASAACRLVAESFPFSSESTLLLAADNHNSVNGMREYARMRGASLDTIPLDGELRLTAAEARLDARRRGPSLVAWPAQSNFSGVRHPLELIAAARDRGWHVLLDAASFVPTSELRLDTVHPDFVAISLYKIAGYPSGLGALIARREALAQLQRPSFAGGTVQWASVQHARHRLLAGVEGFEDGTVPFLAVGAVPAALDAVASVGRERLASHLSALTAELLDELEALRHRSGAPLASVLGPATTESRGATIALALRGADSAVIPYWEVEQAARDEGIAVRGGCFCNPGCAEEAFGFPAGETAKCLQALGDNFTIPRFADCLGGRVVGAIRISLGLGSIRADVSRAISFLSRYAA
jgi:selenocysteine lyase/cysteine desulfurase